MKDNLTHSISNQNIQLPDAPDNGWVKLLEYGDYSHEKGLQRVTQKSADVMAHTFHSIRSRLKRKFAGVPIYIGHPDDPDFQGRPGHTDTRAYGWVTHLNARADGLWVRIQWSDAGAKLIKNKHYQFLSARWEMNYLEENAFIPTRLISIGLTNYPNIPCDALSNEQTLQSQIFHLARKLDIKEEDLTHCLIAIEEKYNELSEFNEDLKQEADNFYRLLVDKENMFLRAQEQLQKLQEQAEQTQKEKLISNTNLKTKSLVGNTHTSPKDHRKAFLQRVQECMQQEGIGYLKAWCQIKVDNPSLFDAFNDFDI